MTDNLSTTELVKMMESIKDPLLKQTVANQVKTRIQNREERKK